MSPEMSLADVLAFYEVADELGIRLWLDGGWAVDACVGEQTRAHSDLDIVVEARDSAALVHRLTAVGFERLPRQDPAPWRFTLVDAHGRQLDIDLIEFDADGTIRYGADQTYPSAAFAGVGLIGERTVRCISPPWLVRFHTGYEVDEDDWHDVSLLCDRFGIAVPSEYDGFVRRSG